MVVSLPRVYPTMGLLEIHDGDTFRLYIDTGFESVHFPWLRLKNYSCPELNEPGGTEALEATRRFLQDNEIWVTTYKVKGWTDMQKTFARYLADVWLGGDPSKGKSLGAELVALGHARFGKI